MYVASTHHIIFYMKMAFPASEETQPFVQTFKQIEEGVRKLPADVIKEKRKDYNESLQSGCKFLIHETVEEQIANELIKQN